MRLKARLPSARVATLVLLFVLPGCLAAPTPMPPPPQQARDGEYTEGFKAGELAQALRDQGPGQQSAETVSTVKSQSPPLPQSPPPSSKAGFNQSGPPMPINAAVPY